MGNTIPKSCTQDDRQEAETVEDKSNGNVKNDDLIIPTAIMEEAEAPGKGVDLEKQLAQEEAAAAETKKKQAEAEEAEKKRAAEEEQRKKEKAAEIKNEKAAEIKNAVSAESIASAQENGYRVWEVVVRKAAATDALGISIVNNKSSVVVTGIDEGVIEKWNRQTAAEFGISVPQIKPGTIIEEANGVRGSDGVQQVLRDATELVLLLKRREKPITIHGADAKQMLGVDINETTLVVQKVHEGGVVAEWNQNCAPGLEICVSDKIAQLNSMCDTQDLHECILKALKSRHLNASGKFKIAFARQGHCA